MSGEVWVLILIVAFVVYRVATRKERKADKEEKRRVLQWAAENALPEVRTNMRVIQESTEIFSTTKNQDTARSRYNLAQERLKELLQCFPQVLFSNSCGSGRLGINNIPYVGRIHFVHSIQVTPKAITCVSATQEIPNAKYNPTNQ